MDSSVIEIWATAAFAVLLIFLIIRAFVYLFAYLKVRSEKKNDKPTSSSKKD